jgi:hypothetical protein
VRINVEFPGGTLGELIDLLSKDEGSAINVIGEKADLGTEIPAFALTNADRPSLAGALDNLLVARGLRLLPSGTVFVLQRRVAEQKNTATEPPNFGSFQLAARLSKELTVDHIVNAIQEAWNLDPTHDPKALRIKYHPATTILLVSGPPAAIDIAGRVIAALPRSGGK